MDFKTSYDFMRDNFDIEKSSYSNNWLSDFINLQGKEIDIIKFRKFANIEKPKNFKEEIILMFEIELEYYIINFISAFIENKAHITEFFNIMLDLGLREVKEFNIEINNKFNAINKIKLILNDNQPPVYEE